MGMTLIPLLRCLHNCVALDVFTKIFSWALKGGQVMLQEAERKKSLDWALSYLHVNLTASLLPLLDFLHNRLHCIIFLNFFLKQNKTGQILIQPPCVRSGSKTKPCLMPWMPGSGLPAFSPSLFMFLSAPPLTTELHGALRIGLAGSKTFEEANPLLLQWAGL